MSDPFLIGYMLRKCKINSHLRLDDSLGMIISKFLLNNCNDEL